MSDSGGSTAHRVELEFDGGLRAKLICPEGGCTPATACGFCGHELGSDEGDGCYDCRDEKGPLDCWIKGWFDNVSAEELLQGKVIIEIDAEWDLDTCIAHIVEPEAVRS